jgi:hypothetical protein
MLVVARYLDGRVVKGETTDFHPALDSFHVRYHSDVPPARIATDGLKALFFVRSLEGNPEYQDHREFPDGPGIRRKVWLEFEDGERMAAWPVAALLGKNGFYVIPTDRDSNLEKAYVFRSSLKTLLEGDEAERAAARTAYRRRSATIHEMVGVG